MVLFSEVSGASPVLREGEGGGVWSLSLLWLVIATAPLRLTSIESIISVDISRRRIVLELLRSSIVFRRFLAKSPTRCTIGIGMP